MLRTWLLPLLLCACLPAQEDLLARIFADPRAVIAHKPIAEPATDGQLVKVVDGESGEAVAGADVLACAQPSDPAVLAQVEELQARVKRETVTSSRAMLLSGALHGTRYRTGEDGTVRVAGGDARLTLIAIAGARIGWGRPGAPVEVRVPREVAVQVLDADGRPAPGVPLGVRQGNTTHFGSPPPRTDNRGRCTLELPRDNGRGELLVAAFLAAAETPSAPVDPAALPPEPVVLRLPPCGQVRFILYGEDERPVPRLREATLTLAGPDRSSRRGGPRASPTTLEPDNCTFAWVEVGCDVAIQATVEGLTEPIVFTGEGPTFAGEFVIVDGRINAGPPILALRLLDQQGAPVAAETVGLVLRGERRYSYSNPITDGEGRLQVPVAVEGLEKLYLLRRREGEGTDYGGAVVHELGELQAGVQDLGDLRLVDEPVVVRARLVDGEGKPVAGVWLRGRTSITTAGSGGGSSNRQLWSFEHRVRSDEDGRFELRELQPADQLIALRTEGDEWTVPGTIQLRPGGPNEEIRAWRTSTFTARLVGEKLEGVNLQAWLLHHETGEKLGANFRDGVLGPLRWASGTCDLQVGDEQAGLLIEDIAAPAGAEVADPRLAPIDWREKLQLVRAAVRDEDGAPVQGATVWCFVQSPGGGRSGRGYGTGEAGAAAFFAPRENVEVAVQAVGFVSQKVEKPGDDVVVNLKRQLAVKVAIEGLPKLPAGIELQADARSDAGGGQAGMPFLPGRSNDVLRDGAATLYFDGPGKCTLDVRFRISGNFAPNLQRNLHRVFAARPLTFEFELAAGVGRPESREFTLSEQQQAELADSIERIQEILDEDEDG